MLGGGEKSYSSEKKVPNVGPGIVPRGRKNEVRHKKDRGEVKSPVKWGGRAKAKGTGKSLIRETVHLEAMIRQKHQVSLFKREQPTLWEEEKPEWAVVLQNWVITGLKSRWGGQANVQGT